MNELLAEVQALVGEEYARAAEKFGRVNNSRHESYAVMLEGYEKAKDEIEIIDCDLGTLWTNIKNNSEEKRIVIRLQSIRQNAEQLAAEAIQLAAMVYKAELTETQKQE